MALIPQPILVDGATHSAQQFRLLVADLARDNEGITRGTDLKVTQLGTPGGAVQVSSGTGVVRGRANTFQGSYAVANTGATSVSIAATGGAGRSDMLILRVEDPEYEGTLDPATDQIAYFQIISNVSSSATAIPDGRTGIPLARIDIPASTSTITNAMIVDIRKIANPRRDRQMLTQFPATTSTNITNSNGSWNNFSTAAGWNIAVPSWASKAKIRVDALQLKYTNQFIGAFRATFGGSLATQSVVLDTNSTGIHRQPATAVDELTIPDAYRGTTQLLRAQATGTTGNTGTLTADASTSFFADIEFLEAPR
jgi:hypothetical protein